MSAAVCVKKDFDKKLVEQRANAMRRNIIIQTHAAGSGHPGGSLSSADIVATLYFGGVMNIGADCLDDPQRDRFILSKGHAAPVLYAALCELGIVAREELVTLRKLGTRLQGHPDHLKLPGVEASTGSLGQGLSISCGIALGVAGHKEQDNVPTVFTLLGDGELQEGQNWEAFMFAAHHKLNNLVAIIDKNDLQIDGYCGDIVTLGDLPSKLRAFGWEVREVDGHDVEEIYKTLVFAKEFSEGPVAIVASTVKGRGVSFMEDVCGWHGKAPSDEEKEKALNEIEEAGRRLS